MRSVSGTSLLIAAGLWAVPARAQVSPDIEKAFDAAIDPAEMGGWMKTMAAEPNHVGSAHNKANAEMTLAQFKGWGWDAKIETFQVLYPTPMKVALELVGPKRFKATLTEGPIPGDADLVAHQGRAAGLRRLPGRWRRHGAAGLRELRHAGRLQGARAHGRSTSRARS